MILDNGSVFLSDTTLGLGMKAIDILKDKFKDAIIIGVQFECDPKEVGYIDSNKVMTPIVSCLLNGVSGVHEYRVDIMDKTLELTR